MSALNGLTVMDFGGFSGGDGATWRKETAVYMDWNEKKMLRDSFWIWRDHEGVKDLTTTNGADFTGRHRFCWDRPTTVEKAATGRISSLHTSGRLSA